MKLSTQATIIQLLTLSAVNAFSPSQINRRVKNGSFSSSQSSLTKVQNTNRATLLMLAAAKVGIFFGTSTGNTENIADLIAAEFGDDAEGPIEIDELQGNLADKFGQFDALVVGTPTWNTGADTERSGVGWDEVYYGEMQDLSLQGKKVAVFGVGDQISYAENYADASGELHDVFETLGCKMMGYTSQEGYEHEASKAIRGEQFCGLLCDEINQDDLSTERVENWVAQLKAEGFMDGGSTTVATGGAAPAQLVEVEAVPVTTPDSHVAELEKENAELRMMLEQNSKLMDEVMQSEGNNVGFTPHYNSKSRVTMWVSGDGRSCYYTTDTPRNP